MKITSDRVVSLIAFLWLLGLFLMCLYSIYLFSSVWQWVILGCIGAAAFVAALWSLYYTVKGYEE